MALRRGDVSDFPGPLLFRRKLSRERRRGAVPGQGDVPLIFPRPAGKRKEQCVLRRRPCRNRREARLSCVSRCNLSLSQSDFRVAVESPLRYGGLSACRPDARRGRGTVVACARRIGAGNFRFARRGIQSHRIGQHLFQRKGNLCLRGGGAVQGIAVLSMVYVRALSRPV